MTDEQVPPTEPTDDDDKLSIHGAIATTLGYIADAARIRVESVRVEWIDVSTLSETRWRIKSIRTKQISDDPDA